MSYILLLILADRVKRFRGSDMLPLMLEALTETYDDRRFLVSLPVEEVGV